MLSRTHKMTIDEATQILNIRKEVWAAALEGVGEGRENAMLTMLKVSTVRCSVRLQVLACCTLRRSEANRFMLSLNRTTEL